MSLTKSSLRKLIRESLKNVQEQERRLQSNRIAHLLREHPKYKSARGISLYLSTDYEIDTVGILKRALEVDKKRCFIPAIGQTGSGPTSGNSRDQEQPRMRMVEIKSMVDYESLPVNRYGIREPQSQGRGPAGAKPGDLDLILVPGVAFSADGRRLGHGKGYYDEFLAHWAAYSSCPIYCIGLALREQMVEETLAREGHDFVLDEILVGASDEANPR